MRLIMLSSSVLSAPVSDEPGARCFGLLMYDFRRFVSRLLCLSSIQQGILTPERVDCDIQLLQFE